MVYLDHAAATPVSAKALEAMLPYFTEQFFNPSAPYLPAKHVREAYEAAKMTSPIPSAPKVLTLSLPPAPPNLSISLSQS